MSKLTNALNRILQWLENHDLHWFEQNLASAYPTLEKRISSIKPGLSSVEIENIIGNFNLQLPEEVKELYQWRNGSQINNWDCVGLFDIYRNYKNFSPAWGFMSFSQLVDRYNKKCDLYQHINFGLRSENIVDSSTILNFQTPLAIEIFISPLDACLTGYIVRDGIDGNFPIVFQNYQGGSDDVVMVYSSLTNMMLTLAESYETAYYLGEESYLKKDTEIFFKIWQKYNSKIIVNTTLKKANLIEQRILELNRVMGFHLLKEIGDILILSRDKRLIYPLIKVLRLKPTRDTQLNENLDYFSRISSMYLGIFGGSDVFIAAIEVLEDRYWLTRYNAAYILGELKTTRALLPLKKLLQDSNEMVREVAQYSIDRIIKQN